MSLIQIPSLPQAISLTGGELIEAVQAGVSVKVTINQFVAAVALGPVSQNQMRSWLAANGVPPYIYTVDFACPADIANPVNIQWLHGSTMRSGDTLYLFIQATLGFTNIQMAAAYVAMQGYPT
jgi:hypothetical protein